MKTYRSLLIYILLACLPLTALHARDKKAKHATGYTPTAMLEPDVSPAKPQRERLIAKAEETHVAPRHHVHVNAKSLEGIDVSHYQGQIDWAAVGRNGKVAYAYIKATEGASLVDDCYERNLRGARRAGISAGSYHFYRPNIDWQTQFENMTATVKLEEQDLVPLIDVETVGGVSDEKLVHDLRLFLEAVTHHYGKRPLLYTYQNFYNKHLAGSFKEYHYMIACYRDEPPQLSDDRDYTFWQYTQTGSIEGVRGNVDRSCLMTPHVLSEIAF